jgi:hypothetical protein
MLNLTLLYLICVGLYQLAYRYFPKLSRLCKALDQIRKNNPMLFLGVALSVLILNHPKGDEWLQTIHWLAHSSEDLNGISQELLDRDSGTRSELFLANVLTRVLAWQIPLP